jgi:hypothetical protein
VEKALYCYAQTVNGRFVSTGIPMSDSTAPQIRRHITESEAVRQEKFTLRHAMRQPPPPAFAARRQRFARLVQTTVCSPAGA